MITKLSKIQVLQLISYKNEYRTFIHEHILLKHPMNSNIIYKDVNIL